ncbi:MAG: hypothetical protein ACRENG_35775, partial [bacterium]
PYLRTDGMALKLMPFQGVRYSPEALRHHLLAVYRYRGLNDPDVYLDDQAQGLAQSYRANFLTLISHHLQRQERREALELLRRMDELMPPTVLPLHSVNAFIQIGKLYAQAGDSTELERRLKQVSP